MKNENIRSSIKRLDTAYSKMARLVGTKLKKDMPTDITGPQYCILNLVSKKGKCAASEIAEALGVNPSATTAMVDRMYKHGLVDRERDQNDRRVVFISLTKKGQNTYEECVEARMKTIERYLAHFEPSEIEAQIHFYEKLAALLQEDEE